ncbi:uncharacterized protein DUF58 [Motilibacter rhizosphaerae]|uniref:Uncharacterized protein DUF58 n=1 Tax=Motilibacter rhizosphaerae TaxID=598652 RepID=A0A4Q7NRW0_9ACTN|nr:DUF58 domain-containing protein [Motilibacter rhizosphaerae]RZS89654.1 uncharacterized protein DUF58 [Motilibacter rhizosphaerae]
MSSRSLELPPPPLVPAATVRRLTLQVSRRLDGILQGEHLGHLPGLGSEAADVRTYEPGDDPRRIDWAVTARTGETAVRTTTAERELETLLVVDLGASMSFGTRTAEKREVGIAVAAAFLHLAKGPGDRVGALLVTQDGLRALPPRGGSAGAYATLSALLRQPRATGAGDEPRLAAALAQAAARQRRRGLVVVVSDLLEPVDEWAPALRRLGARQDVVVAQVVDRRERELPAAGVLRLVDPDSGREVDVATTAKTRARYAELVEERLRQQAAAVRGAHAGHLLVRTEDDWLPQLARFLVRRRRVRSGAARAGDRTAGL